MNILRIFTFGLVLGLGWFLASYLMYAAYMVVVFGG